MKKAPVETKIVSLKRKNYEEYFITVKSDGEATLQTIFEAAARAVKDREARIISQDIIGLNGDRGEAQSLLPAAFGEITWPVAWIYNRTSGGTPGTHLWAVSEIPVESIYLGGRIIGSRFEDESARYCRLGGLLPEDPSLSQAEQTQNLFERMQEVLTKSGLDFSRVYRTWYYNLDILSWYSDFNRVRNAFFEKHDIFNGLVPASTGMAGGNPAGAALQSGLLALESLSPELQLNPVPSPLQCPALEYGSSFNRAVEVISEDARRLYISGTASIDLYGETVHKDDIEGQIKHTLRVVEAILQSRDMSFADSVRGVAYFKHRRDVPHLDGYCRSFGLDPALILFSQNDICRDDLLFEIEIDALKPLFA